ncbi:unnamed protein product [Parascedosporium putredinis]|uniref:Programmed cell death protein 2 C-terminal domain-containing protein n=1 Tax=Parascedosporium putredinis TaxID=1442378 RepID=A0A9P1M905_9PEZI|nr:unnamed protein product [Parascedosporium putredinis]CAI7994810.1 unnamed protein product [Parascedosporium putredinis]
MADYDSDSDIGEFTETTTLLGYVSKDPADDSISRLGGQPEWLDPQKAPSAALARCKACGDIMAMLLQLNGELPEKFPGHERRLFVFGCNKPKCRRKPGSIRALRSLRVSKEAAEKARTEAEATRKAAEEKRLREEKEAEEKAKQPGLGETLFGTKGLGGGALTNPFASGAGGSPANPFASAPKVAAATVATVKAAAEELPKTFAETLSLNNPIAQKPRDPLPPPSRGLRRPNPRPYPDGGARQRENGGGQLRGWLVPHIQGRLRVHHGCRLPKFADRMAQNPEQVIRYEFAGAPLLYSKDDEVAKVLTGRPNIPRCGGCGGERTFELQLTPHAITELEADDMSLEGMDWGTIIVGVCARDCQEHSVEDSEVGYLEEWVGVQWEELGK